MATLYFTSIDHSFRLEVQNESRGKGKHDVRVTHMRKATKAECESLPKGVVNLKHSFDKVIITFSGGKPRVKISTTLVE